MDAQALFDLLDYTPIQLNTVYDPEAVVNKFKTLADYQQAMKATPGFEAYLNSISEHHNQQRVSSLVFRAKVGGFNPEEHSLIFDVRDNLKCVNPNHFHVPRANSQADFKSFIIRESNILGMSRKVFGGKLSDRDIDDEGKEHHCYFNRQRGKTIHSPHSPFCLKAALLIAATLKTSSSFPPVTGMPRTPRKEVPQLPRNDRVTSLREDRQAAALIDDGEDILPDNYYKYQNYKAPKPALLPTLSHPREIPTGGFKPEGQSSGLDGTDELADMAQAMKESCLGEKDSHKKARHFVTLAKLHQKIAEMSDRQQQQQALPPRLQDRRPEPASAETFANPSDSEFKATYHTNQASAITPHSIVTPEKQRWAEEMGRAAVEQSAESPGSSHTVSSTSQAEAPPAKPDYDQVTNDESGSDKQNVEQALAEATDSHQAKADGPKQEMEVE
ncbi:hypothetical protein RvY_15102 [Ramazzottius varieornatus]|uniref:Uncharacterized protein n=1 Tax=Ramazzottius varieornatus TaxID=947166 RepID=A0A1D1VVD5_RAMVA|nr:hypothetical protein RvY_15102 [Ramazzottius varieornatus]